MDRRKHKRADGGRRYLIQLSVLTNIGLFAVINILLVALVHSDRSGASPMHTLKAFIWTNAVAAIATGIAAPYLLSIFDKMQQRVTRQNNELRSLHAIDTAISAELNLDTILQVAVRNATLTVDGELGALWLFAEGDRATTVAESVYNVSETLRPIVKSIMLDRAADRARRSDAPYRRRGLESAWDNDEKLNALKLRNYVTVPIKQQDRILGILAVGNRGELQGSDQGFSTEDEDLLSAIATTVGIAVQNSRLYEETERRGGMLRSLVARIGEAIAASSDASLLMQILSDEAARILGCARVAVYEFDDASEQFLPLAGTDEVSQSRAAADLFFRQPLGMDIVLPPEAEIGGPGDHYYINVHDTLGLGVEIGQFLNRPGFLFVLRSRDHDCIGLLCMLDLAVRSRAEEAWAFAQALASQAAVALENARLAGRTNALLAQARALQDATNKIAQLNVDRVLEGVVDSARSVLEADGYAIWDLDHDSNEWIKRAGHGLSFSRPAPAVVSEEPDWDAAAAANAESAANSIPREVEALQMVMRDQAPLVIPNVAHTPMAANLHLTAKPGERTRGNTVRALLALPLLYAGKTTGVMALYYRTPHTFIPAEVGLAQSFANQAANALENARIFTQLDRLYKREKRIAGELQRSLLPPIPPEIGNFNIAYRYQAGLEEAAIGGDFLDLFFTTPETVGLVIADVSGKGLPAAVQTAMIKYTLRAFSAEIPDDPAKVLDRVNNVLCNRCMPIQGFVTLFYGILNPTTGRFTYANAGHELPLVCDTATGDVCGLPLSDGIALGCMPNMDFESRTVVLEPGNLLLLYTDGLTEARNDSDNFLGTDGLTRLVSCGSDDADVAIQTIYDRVLAYAGDRLRDDVAMLLVQRKPAVPEQSTIEVAA